MCHWRAQLGGTEALSDLLDEDVDVGGVARGDFGDSVLRVDLQMNRTGVVERDLVQMFFADQEFTDRQGGLCQNKGAVEYQLAQACGVASAIHADRDITPEIISGIRGHRDDLDGVITGRDRTGQSPPGAWFGCHGPAAIFDNDHAVIWKNIDFGDELVRAWCGHRGAQST